MKRTIVFLAVIILGIFTSQSNAQAKLSVIATTTDLKALVGEIGGDLIEVQSIAKGTQDPHFIEAKPSYMTKTSKADLIIAVGLDLEVGWLPSIVRGSRNPKLNPGNPGYLEIGPLIDPLEVPSGKMTRAEGDVHPFGNPHFMLDPIRMGTSAIKTAERLGQLDTAHQALYMEKAKALQTRLVEKTKGWQARIAKSGVKKIVTYHKTLTYFFDRFKIENPAILEPKPGIPPTSGHILDVIQIIKAQKVPLIMVENYFDPTVTNRIKEAIPEIRSSTVPVAVDGAPGIKTLDDLYENLVSTVVSATASAAVSTTEGK